MLSHSVFIYICLLSSPKLFCNGELAYGPLESPKDLASNPLLSSDFNDDLSFAVADFEDVGNQTRQLNVRIEEWQIKNFWECLIDYPIANNGTPNKAYPLHLRWLDSPKLVLTWTDKDRTGIRKSKIIAVNMNNCDYSYLGLDNLSFTPVVLPSTYGGFDVFLADKKYCGIAGKRCIIRYDSNFWTVGKPKRFDVHLDWKTMRVERLNNGNYLAHGFQGKGTYRAVVVNHWTGKPTESWTLVEDSPKLNVVSSNLTICWVIDPLKDTSVHCSQFDDRGDLSFTAETKFAKPTTPLAVRVFPNGQLYVLVGNTRFLNDDDGWTLTWANVRRKPDSLKMISTERFKCTGLRESLVIYDIWRSGESMYYGYACKYGDRYAYSRNRFSMTYTEL